MQNWTCKNCGAPLGLNNVQPAMNMIQCTHCGSVYLLPGTNTAPTTPNRTPIPMPAHFNIYSTSSGIQLSYKWNPVTGWVLLIAGAIWTLTTLPSLVFLCFSIPFLVGGIAMIYAGAAYLKNSTHIRIDQGQLTTWSEPLPWFGQSRTLPAGEITQIYCKEHISRTKNGHHYSYEVYMTLRSGQNEKLLGGFNNAEAALFIEQTLEKQLGIQDQAMPGELHR